MVKSFEVVQHILSVLVMGFFGILFGLALMPSYFLYLELTAVTEGRGKLTEAVGVCVSLGVGYILWGVALLMICGLLGRIFRIRKRQGRFYLDHLLLSSGQYHWSRTESPRCFLVW